MDIYHEILLKYWGYKKFRPLQHEIIKSVANGTDTLALMPTGGGKSITFQVPAIAMEGLCLVVTPLIALMKDQVENLNKLGISALAIHSGMSRDEIDITLENAIYGNYKFLYVSPERLGTEIFRVRAENMKINLITVDEAHCISQWGYDFRPSYLKIAELRSILPEATILALTATAAPEVAEDIQDKLEFKNKNLLKVSFARENLVYHVQYSENKTADILKVAKNIKGCGIIYVRSRKKAKEIALNLVKNKISADYYHAGLPHEIRNQKQLSWTKGETRIIVATNAFGMGIDKPDVRFVLHVDLPDSLEAYYQEAGRAGRDRQKSFAILLCNNSDKAVAGQRMAVSFPPADTIKKVYQALGNFLKVPYGSGKDLAYDFHLADFASTYNLNLLTAYNSLKILEREGYLELTDELNNPSRILFLVSREELYKFQVANAGFDAFIKLVLRSYTGVFTNFTGIDEISLAQKAGVQVDVVYKYLGKLNTLGIIKYIPQKKTPLIIYTSERLDEKSLIISKENYKVRKEKYIFRMESVLHYAFSNNTCRSQILLKYFGETDSNPCDVCDVCKRNIEREINESEFNLVVDEIKARLTLGSLSIKELADQVPFKDEKVLEIIRWLIDNDKISYSGGENLVWKE
ncbi:MAG: RecQ family ATP-dependent DNA helicase [Bacteroidales bacterium]|nr:RecQ family ATP-dependent DNA helicase [Bacteroidales bacterium]